MSDVTPWIEHLSDPLVLVGFAIFTLAGLAKLFKPEKLTGKATEGLFHKGLNFVFVLALLIVIGGFAKSIVQQQAAAPQSAIIQHSEGKQSPNSVGVSQRNGLSKAVRGIKARTALAMQRYPYRSEDAARFPPIPSPSPARGEGSKKPR